MATNAPNYGGGARRGGGGGRLSQGATVGVTPGVNGGGIPANVRPLLAPMTKGRNSTTNTQPS